MCGCVVPYSSAMTLCGCVMLARLLMRPDTRPIVIIYTSDIMHGCAWFGVTHNRPTVVDKMRELLPDNRCNGPVNSQSAA